jgi:mono/diheme cytochrome c family protein
MKHVLALAALLGLTFTARHAVLAEEDESGDGEDGGSSVVRAQHDIRCDLRLPDGVTVQAGATADAKVVVRNASRKRERGITVTVFADSASGTPLWTGTLDLRPHHKATRKVHLDVPAGTTSLVALATCDHDDIPGNNMDEEPVGDDSSPGGSTGGTTGGTPGPSAAAIAGKATYDANCIQCHGADARGTSSGPRIVGRSAGDVLEAVREGEDGMPKFPGILTTDAQQIAAFLANPSAVTTPAPTPTPTPTPSGSTPTYTAQVKAILDASCVACHTGTGAPQGIRLDTYATASANAAKALSAMQGGRMPANNPLPAATIQVVADWVAGGTPR